MTMGEAGWSFTRFYDVGKEVGGGGSSRLTVTRVVEAICKREQMCEVVRHSCQRGERILIQQQRSLSSVGFSLIAQAGMKISGNVSTKCDTKKHAEAPPPHTHTSETRLIAVLLSEGVIQDQYLFRDTPFHFQVLRTAAPGPFVEF